MIKGKWKGANEAGVDDCEMCGEPRELRVIHYIGKYPVPEKDHLAICYQCWHVLKMPGWHACGCGG